MDGVDKAVIGVIHLCSTPFRILSLECNLTGRVGADHEIRPVLA